MINIKKSLLFASLCVASLATRPALADTIDVFNADIVGNVTWFATNEYILNGFVYVETNESLTIEAGTVIKGATNASPATIAALVVARGGKIFANGTCQKPIIFTSILDDLLDPGDLGIYQRGLWGGVVILGNARINSAANAAGNASDPKYEVYEGLSVTNVNHVYGGTNDEDSSGVFRFVSIRHGGKILESNKEINGLSLGAVGRGTLIEFVEAYAIQDDGFEFFGGTVNTKHLVSAFNDDEIYDADLGYSGKNQFWFGIQEPGAFDLGMEINGEVSGAVAGAFRTPIGAWEAYNVTLIGSGANPGKLGLRIREAAAPSIYNSIFQGFNGPGVNIDPTSAINLTNGVFNLCNNLWFGFTKNTTNVNNLAALADTTPAEVLFTDTARSNIITSPLLRGVFRTATGRLDPRPQMTSPALGLQRTPPSDGFYEPTYYCGAFGTNGLWISGWTALSAYGIITPDGGTRDPLTGDVDAGSIVQVNNSDISGVVNWYRTNTYILNGFIYVETNEVLNIEAGTLIKGATNASPATIAALVVARGGKIFARGEPCNPIVFTSVLDSIDDGGDLGIYQRGLWGGVVILGNARINSAANAAGNASDPKYEVYEGLSVTNVNHVYGGTNDNDNSGIFRYVSIRHGGKILESNKEINGLSLGAVGRGTLIEFVEAYAIQDDGFEFFGGTVNTKHLVSAFNDDEIYDADLGYTGKNQFWFGIQEPGAFDLGMEINGEVSGAVAGAFRTPIGAWEAYNVTLIGSGANPGKLGLRIREAAAPSIYNSIFQGFNGPGVNIDPTSAINLTNGVFNLCNNLWFGFTKNTTNVNNLAALADTTPAEVLFTDTARSNIITSPLLRGVFRTANSRLDPRPQVVSPAWGLARPVPGGGFYEATDYAGAFGNQNWAADWTALGKYCVFSGAGARIPRAPVVSGTNNCTPPVLVIVLNSTMVNISWPTENGVSYRVQSASNLNGTPIGWANDGAPVNGTGGVVSVNRNTGPAEKYFRVVCQ